jgi:hypothetical protein
VSVEAQQIYNWCYVISQDSRPYGHRNYRVDNFRFLTLREDVSFSSTFFYLSYIFVQDIIVDSSGVKTTVKGVSQYENSFDIQYSEDVYSKYIHCLLTELNVQSSKVQNVKSSSFKQSRRGFNKNTSNQTSNNVGISPNTVNSTKRDFYSSSSSFLRSGSSIAEGYWKSSLSNDNSVSANIVLRSGKIINITFNSIDDKNMFIENIYA